MGCRMADWYNLPATDALRGSSAGRANRDPDQILRCNKGGCFVLHCIARTVTTQGDFPLP